MHLELNLSTNKRLRKSRNNQLRRKFINEGLCSVNKDVEITIIPTLKKSYPDHFLSKSSGIDNDTNSQWII